MALPAPEQDYLNMKIKMRNGLFLLLPVVTLMTTPVESFSVGTSKNANAGRVFVSTPSKPNARKVGDCMSTIPHTLSPDMSVDEAISKLLKLGYSGAPVVDPTSGELIGMVSAFDFLQKEAGGALLPMEGSLENIEAYVGAAKKIVATTVGDLMTSNRIVTVQPTDSMRDAASVMQGERLHRLPVVDSKTGKLVGMLSSSDVMRDVLTTVQQALPERATSDDDDAESVTINTNISP